MSYLECVNDLFRLFLIIPGPDTDALKQDAYLKLLQQALAKYGPIAHSGYRCGLQIQSSKSCLTYMDKMCPPMKSMYTQNQKIRKPLYFSRNLVLQFRRNGSRFQLQRYAISSSVHGLLHVEVTSR